jgi:formylglycine-generating enzyme required for sulfatase activity
MENGMTNPAQDGYIFLSYSRTNKQEAEALRSRLLAAGFAVFRDEDSIRVGENWLKSLQDAVQGCSVFMLLVGRDGVQQQRWVGAEVEVALSRKLSPHDDRERLAILPVLLPEASFNDLPVFLKQIQSLVWHPDNELPQDLLESLQRRSALQSALPSLEGEPYRGLSYFRRKDADRFFGRHEEVLQALRGLGYAEDLAPESFARPNSRCCRWLQIHAASGAGKSSLVHAGMLPRIEQGGLWRRTGGRAEWKILEPMMPGEKPVEMLAEKLTKAFPKLDMDGWLDKLRHLDKPEALARALRPLPNDTAVLLVVDQFEELFTLAEDDERRQFDRLLASALADPECPLFLISTIRSDFLDRFELLPELLKLYNTHKSDYLLPLISETGLRELIVCPARMAGLQIDDGLVEAIVRDTRGEPGVLPLVESTLAELWNEAHLNSEQKLSKAYYEKNNGVVGMLAKQADALIASLGERGRKQALNLLLALTRINEGGRHTRRRLSREDALHEAGGKVDGEKVLQALAGERERQRLAQAVGPLRLIVTDGEQGNGFVELVHEMLIRASDRKDENGRAIGYWPTLYKYIFDNRDRDYQRQQLVVDAQRWQESRGLGRWLGLAGWRDLRVFRRLRPRADSLEGQYLSRSRWVAWIQTGVLAVLFAGLGESVWWAEKNRLPFGYALVKPFWLAGYAVDTPDMVEIPAGHFVMGCVDGRDNMSAVPKCGVMYPDEIPQHEVSLDKPFLLGKYEVTFLEYDYYVWEQKGAGKKVDYPPDAGFGRFNRPVINISWQDAQAYVKWLSQRTGKSYRLPTEAEWEYAARAGTNTAFSWGNEIGEGNANCDDTYCRDAYPETAPVGSFKANPFGLYDMQGNALEWCEDALLPYPRSSDNITSQSHRVLRGGSYLTAPRELRSARRNGFAPDYRYPNTGFRLAGGE